MFLLYVNNAELATIKPDIDLSFGVKFKGSNVSDNESASSL